MSTIVRFSLAAAALACAAPVAQAQMAGAPLPREFGIDGGATFGFGDLEGTSITLPGQNFRVGFFRSPTLSIEPYGSLNYSKVGDVSSTNIALGTGVLYHFNPDRALNQAYLRPFAEVNFLDGSGDNGSEAQFGVGAGLGLKVPWQERFAWRFEGALGYAIESDDNPGGVTLGILAGLSFFSR